MALIPLAGSQTLARLAETDLGSVMEDATGQGRLAAWEVTLGLIGERPLLGHGLGTYQSLFPMARDARFTLMYDYAHNTYLELAAELGLPATVALLAGAVLAFACCLRGTTSGQGLRVLPLAAASGTVAVGMHALVDFGVQIPAVAVSLAVLLGLGCARSAASERIDASTYRRDDGDDTS